MLFPTVVLAGALYITGPGGNVYMAANEVPEGACVMSGTEQLVYEATNINTCNTIVLEPGCYRAELRGGVGLKNDECADFVDLSETSIMSALFSLSEPTTVYVFRGGDGRPGSVNKTSNKHGTFGGGASGVDSLLVVGERVWRAEGGAGNTCTISNNNSALNRLYSATAVAIGNGFGGKSGLSGSVNGYRGFRVYKTDTFGVGGGGGGAPSDLGGTAWQYNNTSSYPDVSVVAGVKGTDLGGGDGGNVTSCKTYKCTDYVSASGGTGGVNVSFSCGGQTAVSYGGGGGGGAVNGSGTSTTYYVNGGNGGSGSTGTSETSFVRIYKM